MRKKDIENVYMFDTRVENIVINEHLIFASGDFVKIYLVGLMYAEMHKSINDKEIAKTVGVDEKIVKEAWEYWEKSNLITRNSDEIEFLNVREQLLSTPTKTIVTEEKNEKTHKLIDKDLSSVFSQIEKISKQPITLPHMEKIKNLIVDVGIDEELVVFAHKYSVEKGKNNTNDYAYNCLIKWIEKDISSVDDAKDYIKDIDASYHIYRKVLNSLGFRRLATDGEMKIIDSWIEKNISLEDMLKACEKTTGIPNPNINYVNKVLMNMIKDRKGVTEDGKVVRKKLNEYLEFLRDKAERERNDRVAKIEKQIPEIIILRDEIRETNFALMKVALKGGADKDALSNKLEYKKKELDRILHKNNIPKDYMDIKYKCPICKDFGNLEDGTPCSCIIEREKEALSWNKV